MAALVVGPSTVDDDGRYKPSLAELPTGNLLGGSTTSETTSVTFNHAAIVSANTVSGERYEALLKRLIDCEAPPEDVTS